MFLSSSTSFPYPSPYFLIFSFRLGVVSATPFLDDDDDPFLSPHVPMWMAGGRKWSAVAPPMLRMLAVGDWGTLLVE
jgi:hypothetical protein